MSIKGGPHIETSGLQLYYDVDNIDSYPGEPTTNLVSNGSFETQSWTGFSYDQKTDGARAFVTNDSKFGSTAVKLTNSTIGPIAFGDSGIAITSGQQYTVSVGVKNIDCPTVPYFSLTSGISGTLNFTGISTTEWKKFSLTATATSTGTGAFYIRTNQNASQGSFLIDGYQIENKPHATPFIDGTRSSTDGLKDLSGNANHADLANTTYDSSALIDYAGSGYATISDSSTLDIQGAMSIGAGINLSSLTTTPSDPAIYARYDGTGAGTRQFWFSYRNASSDKGIALYVVDSSNVLKGAYRTDGSPSTDTGYYVVGVFSPSAYMRIYINGVLDYETTSSIPADVYSTSIDSYIGGSPNYGSGYYFEGKIDLVQQYNRALTATEQLNNYNAVKSRFGH